MSNRGGRRPGAGRKPKAEEQKLIEALSPYEPAALKALQKAIKEGKPWAVKLFFNYRYGLPTAWQEVNISLDNMPEDEVDRYLEKILTNGAK